MKTIKSFSLIAFVALFVSSCISFNGMQGNGNVVRENRNIQEDFDAISISTGISARLITGEASEVIVESDENLQEMIITEVEDGVLKVYSKGNIWGRSTRKVYIKMPRVESISSQSGSNVKSEYPISASDLMLSSSSGSRIDVELNAKFVDADVSSGSSIILKGSADQIKADASSGSSINGRALTAEEAELDVSSGASIRVDVSKFLKASASSGGSIRYTGSPDQISESSSSGGSVSGS